MTLPQTLTLALPGYASLYLLGLLLSLGMLVPFRAGRRPQPWARLPFWIFALLLGATLLPMLTGRPGLAMNAEGLVCAGWDRGVAWQDVEQVTATEEGRRIDLSLRPGSLAPPPLDALDSGLWRWPYWLDGRDGREAAPGATLACWPDTLALPPGLDGQALGRVMALLAEAGRGQVPAAAFDWCFEQGHHSERCLARAPAEHAGCAGAADYAACRAERLAQP